MTRALLLLLCALSASAWFPARAEEGQGRFARCHGADRVTCVVDGDTLWLDGAKIRLADINTPETGRPQCRAEAELGERATRRLMQLLNEGGFTMEPRGNRDTDRYGRLLRVAMRDGESLGDVLVREGLARPWAGRRGS